MASDNAVIKDFSLKKTVYVRFIGRTDFSLAKYHKISLKGFGCFCSKPLKIGETYKVEVNLKMLTNGIIDDIEPHIAAAELKEFTYVGGKQVCWFKFIDFVDNCFENFIKALEYLDSKEKVVSLPVSTKGKAKEPRGIFEIVGKIIENSKKGGFALPVLPKVVREVEKLLRQSDLSIDELAKVIEKDAVISVKILATVNSPFYRTDTQITSIRETIPRLGLKETRNLVLTIANKSFYNIKNKLFKNMVENLWKHTLTSAHCAKAIAESNGFSNTELYYTTGLVHDIGKTIIFRFLSEIFPKKCIAEDKDVVSAVNQFSGEMSRVILSHWGFSEAFVNTVFFHHEKRIDKSVSRVGHVVNTADMMARKMGYDLCEEKNENTALQSMKIINFNSNDFEKVLEQVKVMMDSSDNVF